MLCYSNCLTSITLFTTLQAFLAHGLIAMMYADDSQLYIVMRQSNIRTQKVSTITINSRDMEYMLW